MNLQEQVAQLQTVLPKLSNRDQDFAISLIASFRKYKNLTPKQAPWIGKLIDKATVPAFQVIASSPAPVAQVAVGSFDGVIALFAKAKEKLKFPKITLLVQDKPVTLALAGPKSKNAGSVTIVGEGKYPYRAFYGAVSPEGVLTPWHKTAPEMVEALTAVLTKLAAQPARVAKEHGKLTGRCCFCNKEIGKGKEQRSVHAGFGPDCAAHYGLMTEWKLAVAKGELVAGNKASEVVLEHETLSAAVEILGLGTVAPLDTDALAKEIGSWSVDSVTAVGEAIAAGAVVVPVVDKNSMIALGGLPPAEAIKCFFCEQPSTETKVMHGYTVCPTCAKSLGKV